MSQFPKHYERLPQPLNPANLYHYLLLAYWIFFRPLALKAYLYEAGADIYNESLRRSIFSLRLQRAPGYRRLLAMLPGVLILLLIMVGVPLFLITAVVQQSTPNWNGALLGLLLGLGIGVGAGFIFYESFAFTSGVAGLITFGFGGALTFSIYLGTGMNWRAFAVFGVTWGMAFGIAYGVSRFVVGGVVLALGVGLLGGLSLGLPLGNAAGGVGMSLIGGVISLATFACGALRLPFYPLQLGLAWLSRRHPGWHPLCWDELLVLPLPQSTQLVLNRLRADETAGLRLAVQITHNPFQRWVAQRALQAYLHEVDAPLSLLYRLLQHPDLDAYVPAPISQEDWQQLPSARCLLLGSLNRQNVRYGRDWTYWLADRVMWLLTWRWCDQRVTPLTTFAGLLYDLLEAGEGALPPERIDLAAQAALYTGLTACADGATIAATFAVYARFLAYDTIEALSRAPHDATPALALPPVYRPAQAALRQLADIGAEVATFHDATSRVNRLAALARATDLLDALEEFAVSEVVAPDKNLVLEIIRRWRRLVSEAGGVAARPEALRPIANPYVVGNPVAGELFVGREDILHRLEELWGGTGQWPSVVLYGHRRMGKSSILHNLGARFGAQTVMVDFNMQRVGLVANTGELLYNLALALYDALTSTTLTEPAQDPFCNGNPYTAFDRFIKRIDAARGQRRVVVAIDEFELLEQGIKEGVLQVQLLDFWRGVIQTYPWFVMAFAGLHTLQEMTYDYWHPLFGSVRAIPVSFLSAAAARRLLTQPSPEFPLDYDDDAIERIVALTNGQPYLVQLIGHGLVSRFNRLVFEEGVTREPRLTRDDVETIINAPEFFRDGDAYFTGVWRQAEFSPPPGQTAALRQLASGATPQGEDKAALEALRRHDVLRQTTTGAWEYTVPLLQQWVEHRNSPAHFLPPRPIITKN